MQKLLTALAASAALALFATAAQAECSFHEQVTASTSTPEESVVMSTHDAAPAPTTATVECAPDAKDCVPTNK